MKEQQIYIADIPSISGGEIRISSKDCAVMMEVKHKDLLKKIRSFNDIFNGRKISPVKYWIEGHYIDSKNEKRNCYYLTEEGCKFIAHKTTGENGVVFTDKYMEAFNSMKKELENKNLPSYQIDDPIKRAQAWIKEQKERETLATENKLKQELVNEMLPKASYHDTVLNCAKLISTTDIAKDLGLSAIALHKVLNSKGIIYKRDRDKAWKFYAKYQHMVPEYADYTMSEYCQSLKWTEKGRKFIIDIVEKNQHIVEEVTKKLNRKINGKAKPDIEKANK